MDILYVEDPTNKGVNLHGHVNVTADAAKELSKAITTVGSNWGLGASMVGIGTAVGKAIAKSGMPPVQKAGIIVGGSVISGVGHSMITKINRNSVMLESNSAITTSNSNNISKFMDDTDSYSPLEGILSDINILNITCISLLFILIIQLCFKLYFNTYVKVNLNNYIGIRNSTNLEYYLNKIILLNKKMSTVFIWLIIIFVVLGLFFSYYGSYVLLHNIDSYITVHNSLKK